MSVPTETQALPFPSTLLDHPAFVMLQLLRHGKRRAESAPGGPRLPALMVLASVDEFGPQSQRELCRRLGLDPSDMVAIVDRLEAGGHAVREVDPDDRRRQRIVITGEGRAWMTEALDAARESPLLSGLSARERETLLVLLRRALAAQDDRVPDRFRDERSAAGRDGKGQSL